jgi:formylglycine-generating enzyme
MVKIFVVSILMALAACTYDASFSDCAISCSTTSGCPSDLTCGSEGLCRPPDMTESCATILGGDAAPSQFASCGGLAATCGPNANEDCCSTAQPIPGGTFYRSYDVATDGLYSNMGYPATVSPFVLDKYEASVGRFRKFVEAGMGTQAAAPTTGVGARRLNGTDAQGGWDASWNGYLSADTATLESAVKCDPQHQTWTDAAGANDNLPMNCITWYEAMAFCTWDGGHLPTEAEWNYAASRGDEQRAYPWSIPAESTEIDCSYANYDINVPTGTFCVNGMTGGTNRVGSESPKGDGKWGHADLGGNVFEWTLDSYANPYPMTTCDDCANLAAATFRVIRSGGVDGASTVRTAYRNDHDRPPADRAGTVGVRCARMP